MNQIGLPLLSIADDPATRARIENALPDLYELAIGGTVSPAGGNFDEPVTQATLKVVGAFHGLSRARSDARRYPAIDPLESWSKYTTVVDAEEVEGYRGLRASRERLADAFLVLAFLLLTSVLVLSISSSPLRP